MDKLIEALKERQGERSQAEFATVFGIAPDTLSRILSGNRAPGREVMAQILRVYPDLLYVWLYPERAHTVTESSARVATTHAAFV